MAGATVWLTGPPGAGKTTTARRLAEKLTKAGRSAEVLDGDEIRRAFGSDLGFSKADRDMQVRRLGFMAGLLAKHGVIAIVAAVSPYRETRDEVRRSHETPFLEVFVDCPLDELMRRDPKGLYSRARTGEVQGLTGVSAPYEPPAVPDCHLRTNQKTTDECVQAIVGALARAGVATSRGTPAAP